MLELLNARCEVVGGIRAGGAWSLRFEAEVPLKIEAVVRGTCWHIGSDERPVRLSPGDAVVLNDAGPVTLCSDPAVTPSSPADVARAVQRSFVQLGTGDDVLILGAHVETDATVGVLLTSALPTVTHAIASSPQAEHVRRLLEQIRDEHESARPGAAFARSQLAQLLLVEVLRAALDHEELPQPSWLRLVADPNLSAAVTLMHEEPARSWTLAELAAVAGMSRSHFAHRFRESSGVTPLAYLAQWRIRLAERTLRTSQTTIAELAAQLGYASESSFSHAFARICGVSPTRYRRDHQTRTRPVSVA